MAPSRPILDPDREAVYRTRFLAGLALSLLVLGWLFSRPGAPPSDAEATHLAVRLPEEAIEVELIEPTIQHQTPASAPPPPPSEVLLPPVEVPDTEVIEEQIEEFDLDVPTTEAVPDAPPAPPGPPGPPSPPAGESGPAPLVERPDRSPRAVTIVEPAWPPEARRDDLRVRVRVRVLVDERGRPSQPRIVERIVYGRGDREERVASLPYGMDAAAVDAALRYRFRPARDDGRTVRSYTNVTLSFGV